LRTTGAYPGQSFLVTKGGEELTETKRIACGRILAVPPGAWMKFPPNWGSGNKLITGFPHSTMDKLHNTGASNALYTVWQWQTKTIKLNK
jgi:hypothetical protein